MDSRPFICGGADQRQFLDDLKNNGADLTRSREAVFYFYGKPERLPALQVDLERVGFSVRPTKTDPGRIASVNAVVSESWLREILPVLCELATKHGVEYDGWEASLPEHDQRR